MSNHMKFCGCRYCRSHMGKRPVSDRLTIEVRKMYEDAQPESASTRARTAAEERRTEGEPAKPKEKPTDGDEVEFGDAP